MRRDFTRNFCIMSYLEELLAALYEYLSGKDVSNGNIIRRHTRELENFGDLSFPLDVSNWHVQIEPGQLKENIKTICDYVSSMRGEFSMDALVKASETCFLHILKCSIHSNNVQIYLDRTQAFRQVVKLVYLEKERYGHCSLNTHEDMCVESSCKLDQYDKMNLSELRVILLTNVAVNLLRMCKVNVVNSGRQPCKVKVIFTLKTPKDNGKIILCGAVLNEKGLKDTSTTAEQFLLKRAVDMRLTAEHKYGLRVTTQAGWKQFFDKLGEAAVIIELLQNKPNHTTKIHMNNAVTRNKGASFILYNCARLATLFKEFDRRVSSGSYPELPPIDDIDFSLLNQPEEWELLFTYILQFPITIKDCIKNISDCRFNPHHLVSLLSGLVLTFSIYYRRVKILTEPRQHLFAVLHARIHLLKALEQVVHNGLRLLNIEPETYPNPPVKKGVVKILTSKSLI